MATEDSTSEWREVGAQVSEPAGTLALITRSSTLTRGAELPRPRCLPRRGGFGVVAFSIPLGLMSGAAFQALQPRDLLALSRHDPFRARRPRRTAPPRPELQARNATVRTDRQRGHLPSKSYSAASGEALKSAPPGVLPRLPIRSAELSKTGLRQSFPLGLCPLACCPEFRARDGWHHASSTSLSCKYKSLRAAAMRSSRR